MKTPAILKPVPSLFAGLVLIAGLYAISLYNYLLFHTLVELFSVLTAFVIFALALHTRSLHDDHFLLFIGIALLFTGVLDLLHLISYKGMGIFPPDGGNRATQFWIAFRFVFSLSFLASILFVRTKLKVGPAIVLYVTADSALIAAVLLGWFPDCYLEGTGLTRFKIVSEYAICSIFLVTLVLLIRKRRAFDPVVLRFTALSLLFSIGSEFSFTEYVSVYGFFNMLGHLFLFASVAAMYRAMVVTAVVEPSRLLYRDLKHREEAIAASEKKYRLLFENMTNGFAYHRIVSDRRGRAVDYVFLEVNSAFEALTGLKASGIIGKSVLEVLSGIENDLVDWIGAYGKVAETGQPVRIEQYSAGLRKWFSVSAYSPAPDRLVVIFEDITERKRSEEARQRERDLLQAVMDSAKNMHLVYLDRDFNFVRVNAAYAETCGYRPEEMVGKNHFALYPHEENEAIFRRVRDTGEALEVRDKPFVFPDQPERGVTYWDWTLTPLKDAAGSVTGLVFALRETTEHVRAAEALHTAADELDAIFKAVPYLVSLHDKDGRWRKANPAVTNLFGIDPVNATREEVAQKLQARMPDGTPLTSQNMPSSRALRGEAAFDVEYMITDAMGRDRTLLVNAIPLKKDNMVSGAVLAQTDITERKRMENALRESEARYRGLFEHMLNGFAYCQMVFDEQGRPDDFIYLSVNDSFRRLTGLKDVIGKRVTHIIPDIKKLNPELFEIYGRVASTGNPERFEIDFKPLSLFLSVSVYGPAKGYFVAVFDDITERKHHEERISRLNQLLDTITSSAKLIIATIDKDYRFTYFNTAHHANIQRITGKENRLGMSIPELFAGQPEAQQLARELWGKPLNGETVEQVVEFGPEHYRRFYQTRYVPIVDETGAVVGAGEVSSDITELRKAEAALRESEERLRLTLQSSAVGTFEIDLSTGAGTWNTVEYELLGLKDDEPAGPEAFFRYVHPEDTAGLRSHWEEATRTGRFDTEFRIIRADGQERWLAGKGQLVAIETADAGGADEKMPHLRFLGVNYDITERKRAEEALQQSMRKFELLSGTAGSLLQATEPQKIIDSICRKVMEQLKCDVFFNFLMDEAAWRLHLNSFAGIPDDEARRIEWLDLGVAVCGSAAQSGCRIVAEHIPTTRDPRTDLIRSYGITAYACHPILGPEGKVMGTLSFGTRSRETFSQDELSLMKAVTDQVAVALVRVRDEQALRRAHNELELRVRERTAELARANDELEQEIRVRRLAEKELRASEERFRTSVETLLDGFAILSAVRNASGRIVDFRYEYINEAGCRLNFRSREEHVGHTMLELLPSLRNSDVLNEYVRVAESGEPMTRNQMLFDEVFGGRRLNRAFDLQAVKLGDGFAVVWRDVSDIRETARRIGLTNELLKLFTRKVSRKEYLDVAVELIRSWSGCNHVGVRMLSEDGHIPYASCVEFSPSFLESENMLSIKDDQCACIRVIAEKPETQDSIAMSPHGSFYTNDFSLFLMNLSEEQKQRFRGVCVQSGYQSIAIVPIRYRDTVFGAVHLADERKDMVPYRSVALFEHLALILGEAIFRFGVEEDLLRQREELVRMNEQLRNLSAHVDAVRESERTSIAREIHDELGQVLTAVKMDVTWLRNRLQQSEPHLADKASETAQLTDSAIQSVKRISAELRPGVLDDIGLAAAVEWAVKEFQKRTGIACTVTVNPDTLTVDRTRSTALFRILQESLTNIMRHAHATQVAVSLSEKDDATVLSVTDNGKGIPAEELASPHAFGLIGMRERVQFLHGTIRIESVPDAGTTVVVTLPIHSGMEKPELPGQAALERTPGESDGQGRYAETTES